jgi:hypothetical protein
MKRIIAALLLFSGISYGAARITNADIASGAAIAYSKLNLAASVVNADIASGAAIAYSKLNMASSIVNADISGAAAIAYSKLNLATSIVNGDISASAAIAYSKLAALTSGHLLVGNGSNVATDVAASGDVTLSNTGAFTIASGAVTNAKMANSSTTVNGVSCSLGSTCTVAGGNLSVVTKTANYTLTTSDDVVLANPSGAFTLTLPTAVGNSGKMFRLIKIANDFSNVVTVATTSSQTIGGKSNVHLNTFNEEWELFSDGTNWQIGVHKSVTLDAAYTPTFVNMGTCSTVSIYWRRSGNFLFAHGTFTTGSIASATMSISLPSGLALDTGIIGASNQSVGMYYRDVGSTTTTGLLLAASGHTSNFNLSNVINGGSSPLAGSFPLNSSEFESFWYQAPISGWEE